MGYAGVPLHRYSFRTRGRLLVMKKRKLKLSVWQILALGYFVVVIAGSILLILPFATKQSQSTSYLNALFTSASAACVTGLTPYDVATHWTLFGQLVILALIQLGGLGFMTLVSILFVLFKHGMGLHVRKAVLADSGGNVLSGLKRLVLRILLGTLICEVCGALLLSIRFIADFGALKGIYFSVWHSVSAFCNAGFDLMGTPDTPFVSLTAYATDPLVTITLAILIILGGLGFCVWGDVIDCKCNPKKFQLNTKVVLVMNLVLLIAGTALFLLFERDNPSYESYNFGEKLLCAFFNATTPRTAGFSTTNPATLSDSGYLLTVLLMFIGGSTGSTAGGLKVGTFAVIITGMITVFRGRRDINMGRRRIDNSLLHRALAILTACLMMIILSTMIICAVEPQSEGEFKNTLFLTVSALATVGLSLNDIAALTAVSRIILIILMYAGRVGILTLALALGENKTTAEIRKPLDTLFIG